MFLFRGCCFRGGCFSFTLAAAYFTRVVRCTTVARCADNRRSYYNFNHFSGFDHFNRCRLCHNGCLDDSCFSHNHFSDWLSDWRWSGLDNGRLGNWLADNTGFLGVLGCFLNDWRLDHRRFFAWRGHQRQGCGLH